ncbi:MAG TPA: hypothetical protein VFS08_18590 [Gemmatimonadaceae bacterium]|nr:hypothetical protein [Gemmatimonadaceae bacterium]
MAPTATDRRFELADVAAILAGVAALGSAIWGAPITFDNAYDAPISSLWGAYLVAGVLAIVAVFVAQRRRGLGRGLLAVAGLISLAITLLGGGGWVTARVVHLVLGLIMLAASTSIGRMSSERTI